MKDKIKKEDIIEYVQRKIKKVDIKLQKIDKQVSDNIVDQMAAFEANKRNRKTKNQKMHLQKITKEKIIKLVKFKIQKISRQTWMKTKKIFQKGKEVVQLDKLNY